jgi:hypothetical protein
MNNEIKTHQERLREHGFVSHEHNCELYRAEIAELRARIESLAADAERYKWLRDVGDSTWEPMSKRIHAGGMGIDAAIDAAIAKEKA